MAKNKKSINDLSLLSNLMNNQQIINEPIKKVVNINMKDYQKLWEKKWGQDSFSFSKAKYTPQYPNDLRDALKENTFRIDNFALKLNKFPRWEQDDKDVFKFRFFGKYGKKQDEVKYEIREFYGIDNSGFNALANRHLSNAENIFGKTNLENGTLKSQNFKPDWRVVVGLGTDSVYETGITLHHIYGFPYIPASAIKGITNHFALDMLKVENQEANDKLGKHKVTDEGMLTIFGSTQQKGKITFFDAMPLTAPKLKPDIMNVHYPNYYGGNEPPTDIQNPNPILFLTVEETKFQFILGWQKEKDDDKKDNKSNKTLLETAFEWLTNALQNKGIGAKTAVGYGYMNEQTVTKQKSSN